VGISLTQELTRFVANLDDNLLAVVNVLVWCRVLQHYSTQREIGVLIIIIIEMVSDMKIWMLLSIIFLLAFSVTFIAISAPYTSAQTTLAGALWAMYGEFYVDWFRESAGLYGEGVLWVFAMISNVLLVNLLIAMMSETYQKIKRSADVEWKFGRVNAVLEAVERTHPLPPPFSAPLMLVRFLQWLLVGRCAGAHAPSVNEVRSSDDDEVWCAGGRLDMLKRRREQIAKQTLQEYRRKEDERGELSGDGRLSNIEKLVLDLLIFAEDHEREIKYLREEVGAPSTPGGGRATRKPTRAPSAAVVA